MPGRHRRGDSPHQPAAAALSKEIRRRRTELRWTQQRLADRSSVAYATVRAIESGRVVEPGLFTVRLIADALNVKLDDLLVDDTDGEPAQSPR